MDGLFYSLKDPGKLHIIDVAGNTSYGCNQDWYKTEWQRSSGCGPSVASNIILYMHRTNKISLPFDISDQSDCFKIMCDVWEHVTPTNKGIYELSQFCNGLHDYIKSIGYEFNCFSLNIPNKNKERPGFSRIVQFISEGLSNDCPVAFLNLSNGAISSLDRWHWVTIVSLETESNGKIIVNIYDGEKSIIIDLDLWYETTTLGGGFAYFQKCVS